MALAVTHPTWGLGFGDEVWWSRLAQPAMHTWAPNAQALRLGEKARPKTDPEPKALVQPGRNNTSFRHGAVSAHRSIYTSHGQRLSISERLKVECEQ